jgi:hypothetical protein
MGIAVPGAGICCAVNGDSGTGEAPSADSATSIKPAIPGRTDIPQRPVCSRFVFMLAFVFLSLMSIQYPVGSAFANVLKCRGVNKIRRAPATCDHTNARTIQQPRCSALIKGVVMNPIKPK